ncbi:MAG: PLP-dependent aminotransferase family protein [Agathobacter sp.]|nr:PLP-dependent aminotransferase family protein [Agathobacter sp.]
MNQRDEKSKYYYLYSAIKEDILSGTLKKNEKLPSKRSLAEHLGVSLITVETAYQMLKDEGYIESRERSGYYVTELRLLGKKVETEKVLELLENGPKKQLQLLRNERTEGLEKQTERITHEKSFFPESVYFKTVRSVLTEYGSELLEKSPNEGCAILRNAIAKYLLRYRGIFAQPEQIIIGSGAEHLYSTVVRMFGNEKVYGLEDPSYQQIRMVYEGMGAKCEMLKMGEEGILSTELEKTQADILHITPFHSYPSGVTATVRKRQEYLAWAKFSWDGIFGKGNQEIEESHEAIERNVLGRKSSRLIIEDDFDSEFFMPGKPIDTLYMLDDSQSVIYMNTFSKSLSPSIRIGYMILPEKYLEVYRKKMGDFSCTVPVLDQYVLAEFIDKGHFEQHLNRVRRQRRIG